MTDKWLEDIREKINDCEIDEPAGLRDRIFARQTIILPPRRHSRLWPAMIAAAASVVIILSLACLWRIFEAEPTDNPTLIAHEDAPVIIPASDIRSNTPHIARLDIAPESHSRQATIASTDHTADAIAVQQIETTDKTQEPDENAAVPAVTPQRQISSDNASAATTPTAPTAPLTVQRKHKRNLSVGAYSSGAFGATDRQSAVVNSHVSTYRWLEADDYDYVLMPSVCSRAASEIDTRSIDMHHNIPLRFGLSVRYDFTSRFGIESGIVYSRLSSDFSADGQQKIRGEQILHYLGMPVNVKYRLASWRAFSLYASAGILMEKCLDGTLSKKDVTASSSDNKKSSIRISEDALQWSSNISADLQFDISRHIGVYVEPGISYYFDNRSAVRNIYKDRPFNFNLNLGIRYTFGSPAR